MLVDEFDQAMWGIVEAARKQKYTPTYFMQMLSEHGGVETAKRLLAADLPQDGLNRLWEMGMLQESMEAQVIKEKYAPLFTAAELREARLRLADRGFRIKSNLDK